MTVRAASRSGSYPRHQVPTPVANPKNSSADDQQEKSPQHRDEDALFALPLDDEDDGTYAAVPPFRGPNDSLS